MPKLKLAKFKWDFINLGLISFLSPLYFYKLGESSLSSWDEAWYASIARNILENGNMMILSWNGSPYLDHPPVGFWIIAFFQSIFGFNEYGTRVGSVVFGILGLLFIYLLGREMFSRTVGLVSSLALSSAYWYLFRARSGNLDIFLTVFFIICFYFAIKSINNKKFLFPFFIVLALLMLTKSLIPFTIIPALIILFFKRISFKELLKPFGIFLLIIFLWVLIQMAYSPAVFFRFLQIGTPGFAEKNDYFLNFKQIKEYLHNGIGKWFWPGVLGVLAGPLTKNRNLLVISIFCLTFFLPFIFSNKGHIWHLIPLYPFLILSFFGFLKILSDFMIEKFIKRNIQTLNKLSMLGMILISLYFSHTQIRRAWYEFIDIPTFVTDEEILSAKAGEVPYAFYIDGSDFRPTAVFYSHKNVTLLKDEGFKQLMEGEKDFALITNISRLDELKIPVNKYKIIASDRDKVLIVRAAN